MKHERNGGSLYSPALVLHSWFPVYMDVANVLKEDEIRAI